MANGRRIMVPAALVLLAGAVAGAQPIGTAFTYQGRLTDAGNPASGLYDLQLALFDAAAGGGPVGPLLTRDDVMVTGGLFTVPLDFGAVFAGSKRWLEVRIRPGSGTGSYTALGARQELTPSPSAAFASVVPWAGVAGKPAGFADDVDDDSGGDITGVTAGVGLTGGGASGAITLEVNIGGSGVASSVSRSDHDHALQAWSGSAPSFQALRVTNVGVGGFSDGIWGQGDAAGGGRGLVGYAPAAVGQNFGVWGQADSDTGRGVFGLAAATTGTAIGVHGQTNAPFGYGVRGEASGVAVGVVGRGESNLGVWGATISPSGVATGVLGTSFSSSGRGVVGRVNSATGTTYAIYGESPTSPAGYAGYFAGRVHIVGALTQGLAASRIDHPLDPEHRYLYHAAVESPDMKNVYDGVVTTDSDGYATVTLPDWFEALNRDFRYQLTVIGQFAQAIVAREVAENRFAVRTSAPGVKVSWQVTGIRRDPFAERNRVPVEEDKPVEERGTYLHPAAYDQPAERSVDAIHPPPPLPPLD